MTLPEGYGADSMLREWRPRAAWASMVAPGLQAVAAGTRAEQIDGWVQLVIMLGDSRASDFAALVCLHAQRTWPDAAARFAPHLDFVLCQLGMAGAAGGETGQPVPLVELGREGRIRVDQLRFDAWVEDMLEPFDGDLSRAALFALRIAAIRTGLLTGGPEQPTVAEVLDPALWKLA